MISIGIKDWKKLGFSYLRGHVSAGLAMSASD